MQSVTGDLGIYKGVPWASHANKNGLIVITDLDKTLTQGGPTPNGQELADRRAVRDFIDKKGAVGAAVSARTVGLMLSSTALKKAQKNGYHEPEPHWGIDPQTGKYVFTRIEDDPFFYYCLDWHMAGSFGQDIIVQHQDGYVIDHVYGQQLEFGESEARRLRREKDYERQVKKMGLEQEYARMLELQEETPPPWRASTLALLLGIFLELGLRLDDYLHEIEVKGRYEEGKVNVAPLKARIQLHFHGLQGFRTMQDLISCLAKMRAECNSLAHRVKTVDESKINSEDPDKNLYVLYLVPDVARKENLIRRMVDGVAMAADRPVNSLHAVYADDALTGFKAGLWGPVKKFLLPNGSPLMPYILERSPYYGTESLKMLWKNGHGGKDPFRPVPGMKGVWTYHVRGTRREPNIIVIGDQRYENATAPGSVAEFLEEFATTPAS